MDYFNIRWEKSSYFSLFRRSEISERPKFSAVASTAATAPTAAIEKNLRRRPFPHPKNHISQATLKYGHKF